MAPRKPTIATIGYQGAKLDGFLATLKEAEVDLLIDVREIAFSRRREFMKRALEEKNERVVLIKGDADASYSAVMQAMDDLRKAGIEDIGLITEPKTPKGPTTGGM